MKSLLEICLCTWYKPHNSAGKGEPTDRASEVEQVENRHQDQEQFTTGQCRYLERGGNNCCLFSTLKVSNVPHANSLAY